MRSSLSFLAFLGSPSFRQWVKLSLAGALLCLAAGAVHRPLENRRGRVYFRYGSFLRCSRKLRRLNLMVRTIQKAITKYGLQGERPHGTMSQCHNVRMLPRCYRGGCPTACEVSPMAQPGERQPRPSAPPSLLGQGHHPAGRPVHLTPLLPVCLWCAADLKAELYVNVCDAPQSYDNSLSAGKSGFAVFSTQLTPGSTDILCPDPMDLLAWPQTPPLCPSHGARLSAPPPLLPPALLSQSSHCE